MHSDVAIIGGGLMGVWTALFLRRRGLSVTVVEKGEIGAQASGVNFGNLRLQGRFVGQIPLSLRAQGLWEQLESLIGEHCEYERCGHLFLALDDKQARKLDLYAEEAAAHGIAVEVLDAGRLRERFPYIAGRVLAGSHSLRCATANPRLVTPAAARAARALGARILPRTRVLAIEPRAGRFRLPIAGGDAIEAGAVLNAAGAWAGELAAPLGESVPMFAAGPPQFVTEPVPYFVGPSVQAVDGTVIFRQVRRGNVVVAGYPRGPSDAIANRAPVQPGKLVTAMRRLCELVPRLAGVQVIRAWSGIEGYIPDMLPVIGPSRAVPGLFHAFGFCGHGFQVAPGVGLVMSELIADGRSETPIGDFAIDRFARPLAIDAARLQGEFDAGLLRR